MKRLIKSNAVYEKRATYRRCCWYVHTEVLSRFGQEALPVPCQWTYLTTGAREESREEPQAATGSQGNSPTTPQTSSTTSSSSNKRKSTGSMSITKFMKRCTDPEQVEKRTLNMFLNYHAEFTAIFLFFVHPFCYHFFFFLQRLSSHENMFHMLMVAYYGLKSLYLPDGSNRGRRLSS